MANARGLDLNPREVAATLTRLATWPTPAEEPKRELEHALDALYAMDTLSELDVPVALALETGTAVDTVDHGQEALHGLLREAEHALGGAACRQRISGLEQRSPDHAGALEVSRRRALRRVRRVRQQLAFIRDELDALEEPEFIQQRAERARTVQ